MGSTLSLLSCHGHPRRCRLSQWVDMRRACDAGRWKGNLRVVEIRMIRMMMRLRKCLAVALLSVAVSVCGALLLVVLVDVRGRDGA